MTIVASVSCGVRPMGSRIVGGKEAKPYSWPWQCSLQVKGKHICGCVVVTSEWVITAAHCRYVACLPSSSCQRSQHIMLHMVHRNISYVPLSLACRPSLQHIADISFYMLMQEIVQHYAMIEAARVVQNLCKSCRTFCYFILFYFGARWRNFCTILVQEFYFILLYFVANGRTA